MYKAHCFRRIHTIKLEQWSLTRYGICSYFLRLGLRVLRFVGFRVVGKRVVELALGERVGAGELVCVALDVGALDGCK